MPLFEVCDLINGKSFSPKRVDNMIKDVKMLDDFFNFPPPFSSKAYSLSQSLTLLAHDVILYYLSK